MSGVLEAALARAREGALVLPLWWTNEAGVCACPRGRECRSPGKHPRTEHGVYDASSDEAAIRAWWRRWPRANLAERTDRRPHVDIDLVEVARVLADDVALRAEAEVYRTPRGGLHIVLATDEPMPSRVLRLADGRTLGDLKAGKAYAVLPPSVVGSKRYERLSARSAPPLRVADPVAWISDLLSAFGLALAGSQNEAERAHRRLGRVVREGERHNALISYAGRIWVDGMDAATLGELLQTINQRQCGPPLPREEVEAIARHFVERRTPAPLRVRDGRLPRIVVGNRPLREVVEDAWRAVRERSDGLFLHGGCVAEVRTEQERSRIVHLDVPGLRGYLDRSADWVRKGRQGDQPVLPPREVVEDMLARPEGLAVLRGIVGTPVVLPDGGIAAETGYREATGLYHDPRGEPVPPVSERPDGTDLLRARQLLGAEWLGDFPFADEASRAHVLAAALTPLLRAVIAGPAPLFVVDAPAAGTGKTLLARGIGEVVAGGVPPVMTQPKSEEEFRKAITAVLMAGPPMVIIDNVKGRLASASLTALLTTTGWQDRLLGRTETVTLPAQTVWMVTGNNVQLDQEMARRAVWIRLDACVDRPWARSGFRHEDLMVWVRRHRHELVWALLVLVRHWVARGRPSWRGAALGSFESWIRVVGGVLEAASVSGFLANREALYERADRETEEWRAFTQAWWERFGPEPVGVGELLALAGEVLSSFVGSSRNDGVSERALRTRLGSALARCRDRRYGELVIRQAGRDGHTKAVLWRLEAAGLGSWHAEPSGAKRAGSAEVPQDNRSSADSDAEPAERAEPVLTSARENQSRHTGDTDRERSGDQVPQVPHAPQSDSKPASTRAEPLRNLRNPGAKAAPRCAACGAAMSVVRVSERCGVCLGGVRPAPPRAPAEVWPPDVDAGPAAFGEATR